MNGMMDREVEKRRCRGRQRRGHPQERRISSCKKSILEELARARASRSIVLKGSQKYVKAHVLPNKALAVIIFMNIEERQGSWKSARRISIKTGRRNNEMNTKETRCSAVEGTVFSRFHLTNSLFRVPFRWHRKAKEALEGIEIFPRPICSLFLACRRPSPTPPSTTRHIVA